MIILESNFWNLFLDTHHIIEYGGLILILAIADAGSVFHFAIPYKKIKVRDSNLTNLRSK